MSNSLKGTRGAILVVLGASFFTAWAAEPAEKGALTPQAALWHLRKGNQTFVSGRLTPGKASPARRAALVDAQHPHAVILTCADSRVPPELIFNEGLGDIFVIRVAGAVADPVVVGSVEYAVEHLHAPLVVVMGHTKCGAVKAAIDTPAPAAATGPGANIEAILALLRPGIPKDTPPAELWKAAVYGGVERTVGDLFKLSSILPEKGKAGEIGLVAAVYALETGKVVFSSMVPFGKAEGAAPEGGSLVQWTAPKPAAAAH